MISIVHAALNSQKITNESKTAFDYLEIIPNLDALRMCWKLIRIEKKWFLEICSFSFNLEENCEKGNKKFSFFYLFSK